MTHFKRMVVLLTVGGVTVTAALILADSIADEPGVSRRDHVGTQHAVIDPGAIRRQFERELRGLLNGETSDKKRRDTIPGTCKPVPDDWIPHEFNGMRYYVVPLASATHGQ